MTKHEPCPDISDTKPEGVDWEDVAEWARNLPGMVITVQPASLKAARKHFADDPEYRVIGTGDFVGVQWGARR